MEHQSTRPSEPIEDRPDFSDRLEPTVDEPEQIHQDEDEQTNGAIETARSAADPPAGSTQLVNPLIWGLILAVVFMLGLAIGFLGRPALIKDLPIEVVVTVMPTESEAVAQADAQPGAIGNDQGSAASPDSRPGLSNSGDTSAADPTPTIMDFVLSDARHFQGRETAAVTVVEFSDFN